MKWAYLLSKIGSKIHHDTVTLTVTDFPGDLLLLILQVPCFQVRYPRRTDRLFFLVEFFAFARMLAIFVATASLVLIETFCY